MLAEDPAEFFTMIFGGDAFVDLYARIPDTFPYPTGHTLRLMPCQDRRNLVDEGPHEDYGDLYARNGGRRSRES